MIYREGQAWKVTNVLGGWTVYLVTRSVVDPVTDGMYVGIVLDGDGPMAGDGQGKTIVLMEHNWENNSSYERLF